MSGGERNEREVRPRGPLDAEVGLPGSKSITARALIAASLAQGWVRLIHALDSDDTRRLREGLRAFGVSIEESGEEWRVRGSGGALQAPSRAVNLGGSGTAVRFLTAYAALAPGETVLDGDARLRERPLGDLLQALRSLGVRVETLQKDGCPPVRIWGGGLPGGRTRIRGAVSSQYLSALLLSAPYARRSLEVEVVPPVSSRPYIDMTVRLMEVFGVPVEVEGLCYRAHRGRYRCEEYRIEPDASSASYFLAAAAVAGGRVRIPGLGRNSLQGDAGFVEVLAAMGCSVSAADGALEVVGPARRGIDVDMNRMPDLVPTLAAVAAFLPDPTRIRNVAHLRVKESDRLRAVRLELSKLGAHVEERPDGLEIRGGELHGARIDPHNDHRIAMSLAVAGLKVPGVVIGNPACVEKSFPGFWEQWEALA